MSSSISAEPGSDQGKPATQTPHASLGSSTNTGESSLNGLAKGKGQAPSAPTVTTLGGPPRITRDPELSYAPQVRGLKWRSAGTGGPLDTFDSSGSPIEDDGEQFGISNNALGGTSCTYYLVVPGKTEDGQFVYAGEISHRTQHGLERSAWLNDCFNNSKKLTFWDNSVRRSLMWNEAYEKILTKRGLSIDPQESIERWGSLLVAEANHVKTPSCPEFKLVTTQDLNLLNAWSSVENRPEFSYEKQSPSLHAQSKVARILNGRNKSQSNKLSQEEKCAYILTRNKFSDAGLPEIESTLVLPRAAEDLGRVPEFVWDWFLTSMTSNSPDKKSQTSVWDQVVASVLQKYESFETGALPAPDWLVRSANVCADYWGQLDRIDKSRVLDIMITSCAQTMIDKMCVDKQSGLTTPKMRCLSKLSSIKDITDHVDFWSMEGPPDNALQVAKFVGVNFQPASQTSTAAPWLATTPSRPGGFSNISIPAGIIYAGEEAPPPYCQKEEGCPAASIESTTARMTSTPGPSSQSEQEEFRGTASLPVRPNGTLKPPRSLKKYLCFGGSQ